jgi:hypothetical protein
VGLWLGRPRVELNTSSYPPLLAAGIVGVTFNDLRGTAVTRLALAECTEAEIATTTGHSLRDVRSILDAHYLHRDPALAQIRDRQARKENENVQLSAQPSRADSGHQQTSESKRGRCSPVHALRVKPFKANS